MEGLIRMAIFRDNTINPVEHDRSIEDRRRHRQLVEKSIKENLGDILSEESIAVSYTHLTLPTKRIV